MKPLGSTGQARRRWLKLGLWSLLLQAGGFLAGVVAVSVLAVPALLLFDDSAVADVVWIVGLAAFVAALVAAALLLRHFSGMRGWPLTYRGALLASLPAEFMLLLLFSLPRAGLGVSGPAWLGAVAAALLAVLMLGLIAAVPLLIIRRLGVDQGEQAQ